MRYFISVCWLFPINMRWLTLECDCRYSPCKDQVYWSLFHIKQENFLQERIVKYLADTGHMIYIRHIWSQGIYIYHELTITTNSSTNHERFWKFSVHSWTQWYGFSIVWTKKYSIFCFTCFTTIFHLVPANVFHIIYYN